MFVSKAKSLPQRRAPERVGSGFTFSVKSCPERQQQRHKVLKTLTAIMNVNLNLSPLVTLKAILVPGEP
jgi:hypothetical protein